MSSPGWLATAFEGLGDSQWLTAHAVASVLAVTILTYFHNVVGEMVPKALELQHPARTARRITPLMLAIQQLTLPLVVGLNNAGNGLLHVIGVQRRVGSERYHTSEELQFIVEESQQGGVLRGESGALLRELFDFGDLRVCDVMTPRVRLVGNPVGTAPDELRTTVRGAPHTRYPVYAHDMDHIVGSLHIKDVLSYLVAHQPVTEADARPLPYVP